MSMTLGLATLVALLFLPLLICSLLGFILPPPKRRPDGVLYWITLVPIMCILLVFVAFTMVYAIQDWGQNSPGDRFWTFAIPGILAGVVLGMLANTFWAKSVARKLPEHLSDEDRRESMGRLSRRLWWPLLVVGFVLLVIPAAFVIAVIRHEKATGMKADLGTLRFVP